MAETTGGALVARALEQEGVDTFFGIVDGTYTQLFAHMVELGMRMISPRHESSAAHMAGAWARLTGRLGVCIASNGPGVANILPGVAVENSEGNRVLLLTSSRRTGIANPDRGGAYQCFDHCAVIRPMAKWSESAAAFERIPELLRQALRACFSGRPGVVHLDVPENLINGGGPALALPLPQHYRRCEPIEAPADQVERAADLLAGARLPMIHAGSGVIHARAWDELAALAERLHAPVTTSWAARGALSELSPLAWPMMHVEACTHLRNEADLVLCVGSDVGETDWWGKAPYWALTRAQRWIQVDVDERILGRNRPVELPVLGDARAFLARLLEALRGREMPLAERRKTVSKLAEDKAADRAALDALLARRSAPMVTAHVGVACREVFGDDAVFVFDGGNSAVWGNFFTELRVPNTQLSTAHFGHLGAGIGQALGAAVARPGGQVCCILGDGAMAFQMQEIETAVRHGLAPVFVVCADRQWGMVKISQKVALAPVKDGFKRALGPDHEGTINADLGEIAWDDAARAMGAHGERVSHPDELAPALQRCLAAGRCAVVHVDVDPQAHLLAPGLLHFKAMHQEPAGE
jgi:acetolactate synthase-1/2/3 large subunit